LLAVVPGLTPALTAVPALLVALGLSTGQAMAVLVFGLVLAVADQTTIAPRVYGTALRLPAFVTLLAMLIGGAIMGVWGALVGPPIAAAVDVVLRDRAERADEEPA
jgi:predicted PurR-regulated permease PerM